jgi:hypothetical protein
MAPQLNCEYPELGEARLIEEMVKVVVERMKLQQGRIRRGQHAKATACVRDDDLLALEYPGGTSAAGRHKRAAPGSLFGQPGKESNTEFGVNCRGGQGRVGLRPIRSVVAATRFAG